MPTSIRIKNNVVNRLLYFCNPDKDWQTILTEITEALVDANIKNHYKSPTDMWVKGSSYITYRNDSDENGEYLSDPGNYNPFNFDDIIDKNIEIRVNNQPEKMEYIREREEERENKTSSRFSM